jgi:pyruvate dehydrogenase E2 component (dihydrolipoamide acetyltransferase)
LCQVRDTISKDAALVEVESDKATMEVPAFAGGGVRDVLVKIGDRESKGTLLARLDSAVVAGPSEAAASGSPAPAAASPAIVEATPPAQNDSATGARSRVANGPFHASPAIRRFARELGVNFALVDPIP